MKSAEILLVEDNPAHIRLTQEAFKESNTRNTLHFVMDGEELLSFLYKQGNYMHAPRPDIIILDLYLPKMDGKAVLSKIKSDPNLMFIPIIVLSSSESKEDIKGAYQMNVNCYINKPQFFNEFTAVVRFIEVFWMNIAKIPK